MPRRRLGVALAAGLFLLPAFGRAEPIDNWTKITLSPGAISSPNDVTYVNGRYVAAGSTGKMQHSTDGRTWTVVQTPATNHLTSVAYGAGRYVSVGFYREIVSSTDLNTWELHQRIEDSGFDRYSQVLFANGKFIAVGSNSDVRLSANGTDWTTANMGQTSFNAAGVAWGNGLYVAVGSGNGSACVMTSPDGVTWTKRTVNFTTSFESVGFANGLFVAGGTSLIATSTDGISWTKRNVQFQYSNSRVYAVRYINGRFIAHGQHGMLKSSPNGIDWTNHTTGTTTDIAAVAYNNDRLLLFRYSIVSSGSGAWESDPWAPVGDGNPTDPSNPTPIPGTPSDALLINLSTRAYVGIGGDALFSGFVISGNAPKKVLIRGVGPSLVQFGVEGAIVDPQLKLFNAAGQVISSNDNWSTQANAAEIAQTAGSVGAFPIPADSKDAVLLITLEPGLYSAEISGVENATGVAIVEVYDVQSGNGSRPSNLSARTFTGTGAQITILGFVVQGTQPKTYLIRGIGPTLANFGVNGTLPNPKISLVNSAGAQVASNDDWGTNANVAQLTATAGAVGAFALQAGSQDAALLVTLNPGAYSIAVSDSGSASGVSLVEIYEAP